MKKFRIIPVALFALALCFAQETEAQDVTYSQFYSNPIDLNPALTGVFNCTKRFTANYRNQYSSVFGSNPYNTYSASYDQKIAVGRTDYFGVGGQLWGDVAGALDFGTRSFKLSGAYSKQLSGNRDEKHFVSLGFNAGLTQRSLDWTAAQWGLQHDGNGGFDSSLPAEHTDNGSRLDADFLFADFSAGLLYFNTLEQGKYSYYIGAAAHHLNRANQAIYITDQNGNQVFNPLYTRYTIHGGAEIGMNNGITLVPGIVYFNQGPDVQINGGTAVRFSLGSSRYQEQFLQVGLWTRVSQRVLTSLVDPSDPEGPEISGLETNTWVDAVILYTRFDFREFGIGFSYDINVSDFNEATNSNGAFEFSLQYKICGEERRGVYCPSF